MSVDNLVRYNTYSFWSVRGRSPALAEELDRVASGPPARTNPVRARSFLSPTQSAELPVVVDGSKTGSEQSHLVLAPRYGWNGFWRIEVGSPDTSAHADATIGFNTGETVAIWLGDTHRWEGLVDGNLDEVAAMVRDMGRAVAVYLTGGGETVTRRRFLGGTKTWIHLPLWDETLRAHEVRPPKE